jgi:hypothetical protein
MQKREKINTKDIHELMGRVDWALVDQCLTGLLDLFFPPYKCVIGLLGRQGQWAKIRNLPIEFLFGLI